MTRILVCLLLVTASIQGGQVKFRDRARFARVYLSTVYHVEEDVADSSQLLISTYSTLQTIVKDGHVSLIIGHAMAGHADGIGSEARFNVISGFRQINATHVIVADRKNCCLRLVNRSDRSVESFAGRCTEPGFINGSSLGARFSFPYNIIDGYYENEFYVTDYFNNAIRLVKYSTQTVVTTLVQNSQKLYHPQGVVLDQENLNIFVTVEFGVVKIHIPQATIESLTDNVAGDDNGNMHSSKFRMAPKIIRMYEDVYVIADRGNNELRVLNISQQTVHTLNYEESSAASGTSSCDVGEPYSICFSTDGEKLFVGKKDCVLSIAVEGLAEKYNITPIILRPTRTTPKRGVTTPLLLNHEDNKTTINAVDQINNTIRTGASSPDDEEAPVETNWTIYAIIGSAIVVVTLSNIALFVIMKFRRNRRQRRRGNYGAVPQRSPPPIPPFGPHFQLPPAEYEIPVSTNHHNEMVSINRKQENSWNNPANPRENPVYTRCAVLEASDPCEPSNDDTSNYYEPVTPRKDLPKS